MVWEPAPAHVYSWALEPVVTTEVDTGTEVFDLSASPLRELNARLHALAADGPRRWRVIHPNGAHNVAVGLDADVEVDVEGHVGYYCAGMNQRATVRVHGNAGVGVAENIMSGHGRGRRQRQPVGRRHRARRAARRARRRLVALRDLDEGRRDRRARLDRPHGRVHGPEGRARRLRRRGRRARRLDLRGAPVRARRGARASAPTASRRSCATSTRPSCATCSRAPA